LNLFAPIIDELLSFAVYGEVENRSFGLLITNASIVAGRYQQGTPQDIDDRNFVPKVDFAR
jgi:hypothetical protein